MIMCQESVFWGYGDILKPFCPLLGLAETLACSFLAFGFGGVSGH